MMRGSRQIQRYIRLTELIPELLDMVDKKKLKFNVAVEISFLDKRIQAWLLEYMEDHGGVKLAQVKHLREYIKHSKGISEYKMIEVLNEALTEKPSVSMINIPEEKVQQYFPANYSSE